MQEGEVRRVGDVKSIKIDTRVVAASVRDLKAEIKADRFREDLYYRLNVIEIKLPSLAKRRQDIPALVAHFIEKYAKKFGKRIKAVSPEVMDELKAYSWPGNIRELENVIERAMLIEDGEVIGKGALPMREAANDVCLSVQPEGGLSIKHAHESIERALIRRALEKTGNNKTKAAELLDISMRALLYKIKNYQL